MAVLITAASTLTSLHCQADETTGLFTSTDDDVSTFSPYSYTTNDANKTISLKTLWEWNMGKLDGTNYNCDAYQNDHNLIVKDNTVYTFTAVYYANGKEYPKIRKFNALTGEHQSTITHETITNGGSNSMFFIDDNNNLVLVFVKDTHNDQVTDDFKISTLVLDSDLAISSETVYSYVANTPDYKTKRIPQVANQPEWGELQGDVTSGQFSFSIGGWESEPYFKDLTQETKVYYPSLCKFTCTNSDNGNFLQSDVTRYDSSANESPTFKARDTKYYTNYPWAYMIYINGLTNNIDIVNGFSTTDQTITKMPLMLFQNQGDKLKEEYLKADAAASTYPLMTNISTLTDAKFLSTDGPCYGAYPIILNNDYFLIIPYRFNETDHIQFKLARMTDTTDLNSMEEVATFPADSNRFTYPESKYQYAGLRARVVVIPDESSSKATIYAYMPSSFLGAYEISLTNNSDIVLGLTDINSDDTAIHYSLNGRTLNVTADNEQINVNLYTTTGASVYTSQIRQSSDIDLTNLPSGVYVLKLNNQTSKILLK